MNHICILYRFTKGYAINYCTIFSNNTLKSQSSSQDTLFSRIAKLRTLVKTLKMLLFSSFTKLLLLLKLHFSSPRFLLQFSQTFIHYIGPSSNALRYFRQLSWECAVVLKCQWRSWYFCYGEEFYKKARWLGGPLPREALSRPSQAREILR